MTNTRQVPSQVGRFPMRTFPPSSQHRDSTNGSFHPKKVVTCKLKSTGPYIFNPRSALKRKTRELKSGRKPLRSFAAQTLPYDQTSSQESSEHDPFSRDANVPFSYYVCPHAPFHSNEYLMNGNAHKFNIDASDIYQRLDHTGSMKPLLENSSTTDPYMTIHKLEQENLALKNRIEVLESKLLQLETLAAT
jgi:hypothetical protein